MHEVVIFTLLLYFVIIPFGLIHLVLFDLVFLHFKNTAVNVTWVELDPLGCQHEVHVTVVFEAPVFKDLSEIELGDDLVGCDESIHIGFETHVSIDGFLVELDLDEAIRISTYDEVHFGPVDHDYLFDVVDYVG